MDENFSTYKWESTPELNSYDNWINVGMNRAMITIKNRSHDLIIPTTSSNGRMELIKFMAI